MEFRNSNLIPEAAPSRGPPTGSRRAQFELERRLRWEILVSTPAERAATVARAYTELFKAFPNHDVFLTSDSERRQAGRRGAAMIGPLTHPGDNVLEVGCGRGDVLAQFARIGRGCYGIDPSPQMVRLCSQQPGINVTVGTAERLQFEGRFFDAVFSQQVLEHLHPDDVPRHFAEARRVLKPGGWLAIETPNRRTGPQDISRGFTREAEGLHLKEWSYADLACELRRAGFTQVRGLLAPPYLIRVIPGLHRICRVPAWVRRVEDILLAPLPRLAPRRFIARVLGLDDVFLFAKKPV